MLCQISSYSNQSENLALHVLAFLDFVAKILCELSFEGGSWALVRRTTATSIWHQATDDLAGIDVYGSYGTPASDSIFSIAWSTWLTTGEMLLMTGM